jgi:hypothetical protein
VPERELEPKAFIRPGCREVPAQAAVVWFVRDGETTSRWVSVN